MDAKPVDRQAAVDPTSPANISEGPADRPVPMAARNSRPFRDGAVANGIGTIWSCLLIL